MMMSCVCDFFCPGAKIIVARTLWVVTCVRRKGIVSLVELILMLVYSGKLHGWVRMSSACCSCIRWGHLSSDPSNLT